MQTVQKLQKGFTLIELMIVVAIIGILAAVALPAYQDYVAKSKITSVVATMAAGKTAMFDHYTAEGVMPKGTGVDPNGIDLADSATESFWKTASTQLKASSGATYTTSADTEGTFVVTLANINGNINGKTLTFAYRDFGGSLKFECVNNGTASGGAIKNKYLPKQCHPTALDT